MKEHRLPIIVITFVLVILGISFFNQKGTVVPTISETSAIKEGVKVSFSADKYRKVYTLTQSIQLRPGKYTAIAYSDDSSLFQQEIVVSNGATTPLVITLSKNPNNLLPGSNPDPSVIEKIPYYKLFPRLSGDYKIEAILNDQNSQIAQLKITVIHHFASPHETELYQNERDLSTAQAKQWLKDQGVPNSIPTTVVDEN